MLNLHIPSLDYCLGSMQRVNQEPGAWKLVSKIQVEDQSPVNQAARVNPNRAASSIQIGRFTLSKLVFGILDNTRLTTKRKSLTLKLRRVSGHLEPGRGSNCSCCLLSSVRRATVGDRRATSGQSVCCWLGRVILARKGFSRWYLPRTMEGEWDLPEGEPNQMLNETKIFPFNGF